MGVTGLWKLIEPSGKPVPVETLEGKILAVDISIWLHQVVKGFQDNKGSALANAHLLGLFNRLCKLLYYRVRPVFVFDGCVPQLKRDTIARRQQQRSKLNNEADRIQALLLQSLAKEKVVQQALGANASELLLKALPSSSKTAQNSKDDMFKLPDLPSNNKPATDADEAAATSNLDSSADYSSSDYTETDSSFDEANPRHSYNANLQAIDVRSQHFRNLPADVRHEILVDIKETRKQSSWGRLHELPSQSDDFSVFQMKRLLKRRAVQESLEQAEQEMGGRTLSFAEIQNFFTEEGILQPDAMEGGFKSISSDEHTRFLLVRDLKKQLKMEQVAEENEQLNSSLKSLQKDDEKPSSSAKAMASAQAKVEVEPPSKEQIDNELDKALDSTTVYSERDYEYDGAENLRLNAKQRRQLKNAAIGPARSYMIEYGGMNEEEVQGIMDTTQAKDYDDETEDEQLQAALLQSKMECNAGNAAKQSELGKEYDSDLQRAIAMSLEAAAESKPKSEIFEDKAKAQLEPNDEQLKAVLLQSKVEYLSALAAKCNTTSSASQEINLRVGDSETDTDLEELIEVASKETAKDLPTILKNDAKSKAAGIQNSDDSDTDSDLQEVDEMSPNSATAHITNKSRKLQIVLVLEKPLQQEDDLFSDVFESEIKQLPKDILSLIDAKPKEPADIKEFENSDKIHELSEKPKNETNSQERNKDFKTSKLSYIDTTFEVKSLKPSPIKAANISNLLEELKSQASNIKNISLDNIKLDAESIILNSDEETTLANKPSPLTKQDSRDIIEIYDSDDNQRCVTPKPSKSPKLKTPCKSKAVTDFFQVDYVIKRTPDKPKAELEQANTPKVKSPFFVRKTPKSQRKNNGSNSSSNSTTPNKKISKASKSLFEKEQMTEKLDDSELAKKVDNQAKNTEEILQEAADALKQHKTEQELQDLATNLARERANLESERNRQDRMGMSISQRMNSECQELLRLFGVPYIVAPMEAEAQCAFLNAVDITHGTITDDSDIWLFGGRTVYKNFFDQKKHVLEFRAETIEKDFNCDRNKLIQLACLVGSDYTTGVHGIGTVTALEILASFAPLQEHVVAVASQGMRGDILRVLSTLNKFRDWWLAQKSAAMPPGSSARLALRKKLKNIELQEGFPSSAVVEAYLSPKVDDSLELFSWGQPDVESIQEFARKTFGWTSNKTNDLLQPVLKKLNEKKSQASIRNYFAVKNALSLRQLKVSKRVQEAIDRMSGKAVEEPAVPAKKKRAPAAQAKRGKRKANETSIAEQSATVEQEQQQQSDPIDDLPTTSAAFSAAKNAAETVKRTRRVNIPNTKQVIPQREKDLEILKQNKAKAAEVLRNTRASKTAAKSNKG